MTGTRESAIQDQFGRPAYRGFVWESGQGLTEFGTFGGDNSYVRGINDFGVVVGNADYTNGNSGAIWRNGSIASMPVYGVAINNNEQIAGYVLESGFQAAVFDGTTVQRLGTLGSTPSFAQAINNRGQVVGSSGTSAPSGSPHAFVWSDTTGLVDLSPPETRMSYASDINDRGQVVGSASDIGAVLWQNGQELALDSYTNGAAFAINNAGQITGYSAAAQGQAVASLWQDGQQYDLNSVLGADSNWLLHFASDINDSGQIAVMATRRGVFGPLYAVLLTPAAVPEPQFAGLLLSLLCVSGGVCFTAKRQGRTKAAKTQDSV